MVKGECVAKRGMYSEEGAFTVKRGVCGGGMHGGGMHGRGYAWRRGHALQEKQPLQRSVRIVLE